MEGLINRRYECCNCLRTTHKCGEPFTEEELQEIANATFHEVVNVAGKCCGSFERDYEYEVFRAKQFNCR